VTYDRADLERRLTEGEWLRSGAVAQLLGVNRHTVRNMCLDGRLRWRPSGGGTQRVIDPASVREHMESPKWIGYRTSDAANVDES
jgi:predicted site-specific integrase-resolvase